MLRRIEGMYFVAWVLVLWRWRWTLRWRWKAAWEWEDEQFSSMPCPRCEDGYVRF